MQNIVIHLKFIFLGFRIPYIFLSFRIALLSIFTSCKPLPNSLTQVAQVSCVDSVQEVRLSPGQSEMDVSFSLVNKGLSPQAVESIESECGCILTKGNLPELPAGSSSHLGITLRPTKEMQGKRLTKDVRVKFHGFEERMNLKLNLDVPITCVINPDALVWKAAVRDRKELTVRSALPIKLQGIKASSSGFQWELQDASEPTQELKIKVWPTEAKVVSGVLFLEVSLPGPWRYISVPLKVNG